VVGSHGMPASAQMWANDAQYDNPLRGALLHTEAPPVAGVRTADDEIIRGGGRAGRPEHGPWVVPGAATTSQIPGHFRAVPVKRAFSCTRGQRLAPKASDSAGGPAGLAGAGNLSLAFPPRDRRRACDEGGQ
jgi:hypothetical protein